MRTHLLLEGGAEREAVDLLGAVVDRDEDKAVGCRVLAGGDELDAHRRVDACVSFAELQAVLGRGMRGCGGGGGGGG